jgi:hypothetical protein
MLVKREIIEVFIAPPEFRADPVIADTSSENKLRHSETTVTNQNCIRREIGLNSASVSYIQLRIFYFHIFYPKT